MNDDLGDKNVIVFFIEVFLVCVIGEGNGVIGSWIIVSLL